MAGGVNESRELLSASPKSISFFLVLPDGVRGSVRSVRTRKARRKQP